MAYDNVNFVDGNITFANGYFYTVDPFSNYLIEKTSDGSISFMYPLDTVFEMDGQCYDDNVVVANLEYKNGCFYTLQDQQYWWQEDVGWPFELYDEYMVKIKQWKIENSICVLKSAYYYGIFKYYGYNNRDNYHKYIHLWPTTRYNSNTVVITDKYMWIFNDYYDDAKIGGLYRIGIDGHYNVQLGKYNNSLYKNVMSATLCGEDKIFFTAEDSSVLNILDVSAYNIDSILDDPDYITVTSGCMNDDFTYILGSRTSIDDKLCNGHPVYVEIGDPYIKWGNYIYDEMRCEYTYGTVSIPRTSVPMQGIVTNYYLVDDFEVEIFCSSVEFNAGVSPNWMYSSSFHFISMNNSYRVGITYKYSDAVGSEMHSVFGAPAPTDYSTYGMTTISGLSVPGKDFKLKLNRTDDVFYFYWDAASGTSWKSLGSYDVSDYSSADFYNEELGNLLIATELASIDLGITAFDNLSYSTTTTGVMYDHFTTGSIDFQGAMAIDNIKTDQTVIPIYDMVSVDDSLYRLQKEANYYGVDISWGDMYNYVVSPLYSFVDSITVTAYPLIVPADGFSTLEVRASVNDQYGEGALYDPVFFTDTDDVGYLTINPAYTDVFFRNGVAVTYYRSGVIPATVTIEGTVSQK
jgi:hypothetical protein